MLIKKQKQKNIILFFFFFRNKTNHTLVGRYTTFCVDPFFFFLNHLQLEQTIFKTLVDYSGLVDKTVYLENVIMIDKFLG